MSILVLNTAILAVDPVDAGDHWQTADQIIPKHVASGAVVVDVQPPADYAPGKYTYNGGFVLVPPPARPADEVQAEIVQATQKRLDDFARTRNYDGILSACTYATSSVPKFSAEGQYCVGARDATWAKLYSIMGEVQAGQRPMPAGFADIESELPSLTWPV